ncbi:hypothetical protein EG328_002234 [Venturia inaequalis]|uniref:Peroxin/Ferlin domain-containing protein n=1 Tax=Venturia inaequalis TaxID=5025 RepID=A0A8H3V1F2_VENIN|nr:hypothetical protein EG327_006657 [Venturia inaequalis]KAE9987593.1 hypothetical protein EG328_002234 [Venturia inaequalis]
MSTPSKSPQHVSQGPSGESNSNAPTIAAFSPATLNHSPSALKQRSTILVHQKSPLLVATPPQITRALAYSHPFIAPLNKFAGLLSWTHTDPWESFLMVASFWAITLYGDVFLRLAGPLVCVAFLILGMWSRRYSPLSSNATTGEKGPKGHTRGLDVAVPTETDGRPPLPPRRPRTAHEIAASLARKRRPDSPGIRFTFTLYENQRRWLGIGWTSSMLAYERAPWTDEHLNSSSPRDRFELPEVEGGHARWRWVEGSAWHVEGTEKSPDGKHSEPEDGGWIYYDNKWHDGRRGRDGWGRYTRRRKWCRDAELVEVTPSTETTPSPTPGLVPLDEDDALAVSTATIVTSGAASSKAAIDDETDGSISGSKTRKRWYRRSSNTASQKSTAGSGSVTSSLKSYPDEDDIYRPSLSSPSREDSWGLGEDASMQMG